VEELKVAPPEQRFSALAVLLEWAVRFDLVASVDYLLQNHAPVDGMHAILSGWVGGVVQ
jgi:hypothetical protein